MTSSKTDKKPNAIWRFFSSVRLTIVLLIILAIASIIGTVIPQQGQGAVEFAKSLSPEWFRFLSFLNLFDMYHSVWFRLLLGCLGLNLIICSVDRFSGAWKRFSTIPRPDREKPFEHLPPEQTFSIQTKMGNAAHSIGRLLQTRYKKTQNKEAGHRHFFYGEKGGYSHFGVYLIHLSVLAILIGGLVGSFFGFEAYVNIVEGGKIDTVTLRKGMTPLELGFEVRCDKFTVDFYENGAPKEYRSDLTFFENGKEVEKRSALVNHPIQFRGVTFYQASYGKLPGKKVRLKISTHASKDDITTLVVEPGHPMQLPGKEGQFRIVDAKGDFMGMGPAVLVLIQPQQGAETHFWVFQHPQMVMKRLPGPMAQSSKFNASAFKPYTFFLDDLESAYYTGLQVNRDPGVNIVWLGCFLMVAGFFVAFFTSHRKIWVRLSEEKEGIRISVAGTANKNPVGFQRELENLTNDLKDMFSEKG
ncbi:MAG: cytochrome c biogenesis protein ResB [Deltaproteobacteria bacterium]|nr:cytochrome c biogenesis protein ResB [Deltaproteobacteria bacterium]